MQHAARLVSLLFVMFASLARAQPLAATCYSPDRLGWSGPGTSLGCHPCCGCRSAEYELQWQSRDEDAGWSTQPISSSASRFVGRPFATLTHLSRYCFRMRYADDAGPGEWGPSSTPMCGNAGSDVCFTWDSVPPETPVLLDGGVVAGTNRVELHFAPSDDDGGGVSGYRFRYLPSSSAAIGSFGSGPDSPISDILGAGTWRVALYAEDRANNISNNSASMTVTLGFDASVATPAAPGWPKAITNETYVELMWMNDGAESWVVTQRTTDGGWAITARPRVSGSSALLSVPGPCQRHSGRIARVLGDQASDWSPPAPDLLVDTVAPVAFPPTLVSFENGVASLSWPTATDGCESGLSYQVERSLNGGPFTAQMTTTSTQYDDPVSDFGQLTWRIVAIDGAGNQGISDAGDSVLVAGTDGGVEVLEPDGGTRPGKSSFLVGCGCDGGSSTLILLVVAMLLRGHRVGGFRIS